MLHSSSVVTALGRSFMRDGVAQGSGGALALSLSLLRHCPPWYCIVLSMDDSKEQAENSTPLTIEPGEGN